MAYLLASGSPRSDFSAAALAYDELVSNVIRHAAGFIEITVEWPECAPILSVRDRGPGFTPRIALPDAVDSEAGRGLFLVATLAGPMSVQRLADGSCVTVTLPVHRAGCNRDGRP